MNELGKLLTVSCMIWSGVIGNFDSKPMIESDLKIEETQVVSGYEIETETEYETESETEQAPVQTYETELLQLSSCAIETEAECDIFTDEEIELIALVTMAEAEGESEYGKRLVIDTIINRVNSEHFPDTVSDVIYQPWQFESIWNGRVNRCYVDDYICELVREEMVELTDPYVMFFCAGDYGQYGEPMYQVDNHYFSSY